LRVQEIMDAKYPSIRENEYVTNARAMLRDFSLRILPVVNKDKRLIGVLSRREIMTISSAISPIEVKGVMTEPKQTSTLTGDAFQVVKQMIRLDEWYIPIVNSPNEKTYKGVLGLQNFIDAILKISPEKLSKPVSDAMCKDPLVICSPDDEVDDVWRLMQDRSFAGLPVTKGKKLIGIVTQQDLLQSGRTFPGFEGDKGRHRAPSKISQVMKTGIVTVQPSVKVIRAAKVMVSKDIGRIPVTDEKDNLIGIVDREDVANLIINERVR
jgi:CBS domain-containing protein